MHRSGKSIKATIEAVEAIISAIHSGRLPAHPTAGSIPLQSVRWTPSYVMGLPAQNVESKPYTAGHLSTLLLGNARNKRAHNVVGLALALLELKERGEITDGDLEDIFADSAPISEHQRVVGRARNGWRQLAEELLQTAQIASDHTQ
jgi:hypothetical protein